MSSKDYLESLLDELKKYSVPDWILKNIRNVVKAHVGRNLILRSKVAKEIPNLEKILDSAPKEGGMLDLGSGGKAPEGFLGFDINPNLQQGELAADLEEGIPEGDNLASVVRANHSLEHISDPDKIMREIHRVLQPGGIAIITVPSTKGEGAFAHPEHKSFWNKSSFAFWTDDKFSESRPVFELEHLEERGSGDRIFVDAVLRKPISPIFKDEEGSTKSKDYTINICKIDKEKQVVTGIVLDPYIVDSQDDWISPNDVEKAMYGWMENSQQIGLRHNGVTKNAVVVESYLFPYPTTEDYTAAMNGKEHSIYKMKIGDDYVHSGSGIVSFLVKDTDLWSDIKSRKFNAFSIGGKGKRRKGLKSNLPKVKKVLKIG